jgi:hypothetical protein
MITIEGEVMKVIAVVLAAMVVCAVPASADSTLGDAGKGGYDGIPVIPGDGIGPGGALPEGFLAMPGPYLDVIGPSVYSSLEDLR